MATRNIAPSLAGDQLKIARRAILDTLHDTMAYALDQVDQLRQEAWPPGVIAEDCRNTVQHMLREIEAMNALGWPE